MDRNKELTFLSKLGQIYSVLFLRFIKKKKKKFMNEGGDMEWKDPVKFLDP